MKLYEFDSFIKELETIEAFVTEVAAREEELLSLGLHRVRSWPVFEAATPLLNDFDRSIHGFLQLSRTIDKSLHTSITKLIEDTSLSNDLGKLFVTLKIASERRPTPPMVSFYNTITLNFAYFFNRIRRKNLFSEDHVPLQQILVSLHRLIPLVKRVYDIYIENWQSDDEIFKPSNIDREVVINYIEQTIMSVQTIVINPEQKEKLLNHLNQTKNDLAEDNIPWKKVIGALLIASTLLGGLADAPQAIENVNKAIKYILGTSIERLSTPTLPSFTTPPSIPSLPSNIPSIPRDLHSEEFLLT